MGKLRGTDPPAWRLRIGDYRIVYEIRDTELIVLVVNVGSRSRIHR